MKALPLPDALAVQPRPAATTLILRDGDEGLEVLMVRRSLEARFMPGAHVFPGGAVDAEDGSAEHATACDESPEALALRVGGPTGTGAAALAFAVAALRETFEECGLWLGASVPPPGLSARRAQLREGALLARLANAAGECLRTTALVPWSHWVTPLGLHRRFDTVFFVAGAPPGQTPLVDAGETTALAWVHPPRALSLHAEGGFPMEFATVTTVRSLVPFAAGPVSAVLDHAARLRDLAPVHPRLELGEARSIRRVLLPGEPGYDTAELRD